MKIKDLLGVINKFAPFFLQESYDNSGLQIGDLEAEVTKIALALEVTDESIEFAIHSGANVLLTHHPILFFSTKTVIKQEKPFLYKALKNGLNLIAAHTNFDVAENGLNDYVSNLLSINKRGPIQPANEKIFKLSFYVPVEYADKVKDAVFSTGAGVIGNYDRASFNVEGIGTFRPLEGTHPFIGEKGKVAYTKEVKVETVVKERYLQDAVSALLKTHPYEEPAYDIYELRLTNKFGIGTVGSVKSFATLENFANFVKSKLDAEYVRIVRSLDAPINTVAFCSGAGGTLLETVARLGVDVFVSGDISYHTAVRAKELGLNLIDVEHFDSEKFFKQAMFAQLVRYGISKSIITLYNEEGSPFKIIK